MCTTSWVYQDDGYDLFFNRDELLTRGAGIPPERFVSRGVRFIAPRDRDAGGTWIAVNENGVTLAIMNYFARDASVDGGGAPFPVARSRGEIIPACIAEPTADAVDTRLTLLDPRRWYRPFVLLRVAPDGEAVTWTFDGDAIHRRTAHPPVVTSGYRPEEVARRRRARYRELERLRGGISPEVLEEYHRSTDPERTELGVAVEREDAATVSMSHVQVRDDHVRIRYVDGMPARGGTEHVVDLGASRAQAGIAAIPWGSVQRAGAAEGS